MRVLKFGGTSVANAENINKVVAISQQSVLKNKTFVVVSALSGVTDLLLETASLSSKQDEKYKESLALIESKHLTAVKALIPLNEQSAVLSQVKKMCNELESLCGRNLLIERTITPCQR
jgi:bifunctional aspartokinase / homoserine dehydrogenase 1